MKTNDEHGEEARKRAARQLHEIADQIANDAEADVTWSRTFDHKPKVGSDGLYGGVTLMGETLHIDLRWPGGKKD